MVDTLDMSLDFSMDDGTPVQESFTGTAGSFSDFMNGKFMAFDPDNILSGGAMKSGMFPIDIEDSDMAINYNWQGKGDPGLARPGRLS